MKAISAVILLMSRNTHVWDGQASFMIGSSHLMPHEKFRRFEEQSLLQSAYNLADAEHGAGGGCTRHRPRSNGFSAFDDSVPRLLAIVPTIPP